MKFAQKLYPSIFESVPNILKFSPQLKGLSVRALTLMAFRDTVLLKTDIQEALQLDPPPLISPELRQMCLVLQSVHKTPPTEQFFTLQAIVQCVVKSYLVMVAQPSVTKSCEVVNGESLVLSHPCM